MNQPNEQPADAGGQAAGSRSNQHNKIIAQVEKYLKYGFNVIPCWPRTKNPAIKHWKEYQGRLATEEERAEWFSQKGMWPYSPDRFQKYLFWIQM